jgi:hypothetical protein
MKHQLPIEVQTKIETALQDIRAEPNEEINTQHILDIVALFGTKGTPQQSLNRSQKHQLLLYLLTMKHLSKIYANVEPQDTIIEDYIHDALDLIIQRLPPEHIAERLDQLWSYTENSTNKYTIQENIRTSLYTFTKAVDQYINQESLSDDFPIEVHVSVALVYLSRAYILYIQHQDNVQRRNSFNFWQFWLEQIVPRAWLP